MPQRLRSLVIVTCVLFVLVETNIGCVPQRPEILNKTHDNGSPTIFVVSNRRTTRKELNNEIEAMPIWLHSRYSSPNGKSIYMGNLLKRSIFFRAALVDQIDQKAETYKRYEATLLHWFLNQKIRLPVLDEAEQLQFLDTPEGKKKYDVKDIYVIYTASKALGDTIYKEISVLPAEKRLDAFKDASKRYSLNPFNEQALPLVGAYSKTSYEEAQTKKPFSFLTIENTPSTDLRVNIIGKIGPLDWEAPAWSVTKPVRNAKLWKVYLIGELKEAAKELKRKENDLPISDINNDIMNLRKKRLLEKL